ncbi:MAG: serine/threonine protein kinase [Polyangiaceae bacterium]|nr:serine/threonine protein kinase [Polyangiaceae bacterium]
MAREFSPGDVLAEKFRLVSQLGAGGMGSVWRAEHLLLRSPVAIKLIHDRVASAPGAVDRFLLEARAAAALRSPHVIQVLDFGVEGSTPYLVMELLEGESLAARLARVGRLSLAETSRIVSHVARALSRAHEAGVVHRDLKPDNVFLVTNQDEELAKVLDFGIAKTLGTGDGAVGGLTQTGAVLGTPHYMSPEQARGRSDVDHRSDLWSLGVIAYECVTGLRPFDSATLGDLLLKICADPIPTAAGAPPGFDAWLARALARDPNQRFQSASDLADALRALSAIPLSAAIMPPTHVPIHSLPAPRRSSAAPVLVAVVAMGFLLVFGAVGAGAAYLLGAFGSTPSAASTAVASASAEPAPASADPAPASMPSSKPVAGTAPKSSRPPGATSTPATPTAPGSSPPPAPSADACAKACGKLQACGYKCPSFACIGPYKAIADCVNAKSTCLAMAECSK